MRYLIIALFPLFGYSQIITEHLIQESKVYNPLFSKEKGNIKIRLDMTYTYPKSDTVFNCVIDISERKIKLEGVSNSANISGAISSYNDYGILGGIAALGFGSNRSYSYNNTKGVAVLDYKTFDTLLKNVSIIREFTKFNKGIPKTLIFKSGKVLLGLDMKLIKDETLGFILENFYYIQVDDSTYKLSEAEFKEMTGGILIEVQKIWDIYNSSGTVQYKLAS